MDVTIQQKFQKWNIFSRDSEKAKGINDKQMEFIALDNQLFSEVKSLSFHEFIAHLELRHTFPSSHFFSDVAL